MSQRSMPGAGPGLIRLDGVTKRYGHGAAPAVADVSLAVAAGEAVAITGPSGSGKSTLLSLIAGMGRPTSGVVRVGEERVDTLSEAAAARFRRRRARPGRLGGRHPHRFRAARRVRQPVSFTAHAGSGSRPRPSRTFASRSARGRSASAAAGKTPCRRRAAPG
jgi:energy-coupling factor transporter ATP-binding protein EcfA2